MNVLDVMAARRSVRAFTPKQPRRIIIESILRNAARAPSVKNLQPWSVRVFSGDALTEIVTAAAAGENRLASQPAKWAEAGLSVSADRAAVRRGGLRFYEAPVGLLCTIRKQAGLIEWLDHGCFVYAVGLAAAAFELDTCIIGDFNGLDDLLAAEAQLNLAEEEISVGIGLGYAEGVRRPLLERRPLDEFATFYWD